MTSSARRSGILLLLFTAVGWGFAWPAMKTVLHAWPPLFARGLSGMAAAIALAALAAALGQSLVVPRRHWVRLGIAAFTNVFAWMGFSNLALKSLNVGEGALLVYTMPIWATAFAWPLTGARPTPRGLAALGLGVIGVSIILVGPGFGLGGGKLVGAGFALGAAICFALGTVTAGAPLPVPPIALTAWLVGLGCTPMLLLGLATEHPDFGALRGVGWVAMAYVTVVAMALCYLAWFAALRRLPATTASTAMLAVPIIGVISAALLLGEPLGLRELVAMVLTLAGVTLALRKA